MLPKFIESNRDDLIALCNASAARRGTQAAQVGAPHFLDALAAALTAASRKHRGESPACAECSGALEDIDSIAGRRGMEMLAQGAPVQWVIHEYGDVCQAITQLAQQRRVRLSPREFESLNLCLDNAMAAAVAEYAHQRDLRAAQESAETMHESLGRLADELRLPLAASLDAAADMRRAGAASNGPEAQRLERGLVGLREVIDRSLAMIRLGSGMTACPESIALGDWIAEIAPRARLEAQAAGCHLEIDPSGASFVVHADRQLLTASFRAVLAAALRAAETGGRIRVRAVASYTRIFIEVGHEAAEARASRTEQCVEQRATSRALPAQEQIVAERMVQEVGGRFKARDLPGTGAIYGIELRRERLAESAAVDV